MGDAADILGIQKPKSNANDPFSIMSGLDKAAAPAKPDKKKKPKGMSREVFNLMGKDGIAPSLQTNADPKNAGFKNKRQSTTQGKWVWTEYHSSARSDSQPFYHWVKADLQAFDYVYAKFNTKLDPVTYTSEEYESLLRVPCWTRSETDQFMAACHAFNLRWPVIADRFEATSHRSTEDLMARYYFIVTKLKQQRSDKRGGSLSSQIVPATTFDVEFERCRRKQQDLLLQLSPEEQAKEAALREELRSLDASIKKIKKSLKQQAAPQAPQAAAAGAKAVATASSSTSSKKKGGGQKDGATAAPLAPSTAASIAAASQGGSVAAAVLLKAMPPIVMYGGVMTPAPGQPCLQSARLAFSSCDLPDFSKKVVTGFEGASGLDLSEPFVVKMKHFGQELGMPDKLLPTRAVCDLNDQIRRDMALLLSLQSKITHNEEKISCIREQNPQISGLAFSGAGARGGSASAPECRLALPDTTLLLKDADSAGHALPAVRPYVPGAPLVLVPPPPVPVERQGPAEKDKGVAGTGSGGAKASKATAAAGTAADTAGKPTKKATKSKRKAGEVSKDTEAASPSSGAVEAKAKAKPAAASAAAGAGTGGALKAAPVVKKINPVLARAATIPIPPLNNTPQSIAIAAAANAAKAKLAAEQRAAEHEQAATSASVFGRPAVPGGAGSEGADLSASSSSSAHPSLSVTGSGAGSVSAIGSAAALLLGDEEPSLKKARQNSN